MSYFCAGSTHHAAGSPGLPYDYTAVLGVIDTTEQAGLQLMGVTLGCIGKSVVVVQEGAHSETAEWPWD